jgi:hypothetical protein
MTDPKKAKQAEIASQFKEARLLLLMDEAAFAHALGHPGGKRHLLTRKINGTVPWAEGELAATRKRLADVIEKAAAALNAMAAQITTTINS